MRSRSVGLTPLPTPPAPLTHQKPTGILNQTRPPAFYDTLKTVDPHFLAKIHKNMQEKVYMRFKNMREAFRRFDLDHSGAIDFREFKTVLRELELIGRQDDDKQVE